MKSIVMDVLKDHALETGPHPAETGKWQHFTLTRDADGIAWLLFDRNGKSANTLSAEVMEELGQVVGTLESNPPKGLVVRSAKPSGFIAGADINEFVGARDVGDVQATMGRANDICDRLAALPVPSVAVIHGFCLGGGLEIALACKYRLAIDSARFGFPEILLGLHPGLGGTARFSHLVSPAAAMEMRATTPTRMMYSTRLAPRVSRRKRFIFITSGRE